MTFALALSRRFDWKDVAPYWVAQCLGAIVGALVISGIYGDAGIASSFGSTLVAPGIDIPQAILAEAAITFVLVTAIMAIAIDPGPLKGGRDS